MQIDGIDIDKLPADESGTFCGQAFVTLVGEAVDAQLESRLEGLQAGTDQLLVEITELRRRCPAEIRDKFVLGLEDLERAMPGVQEVLSPLEASLDVHPETVDNLLGELARLRQLNEVSALGLCVGAHFVRRASRNWRQSCSVHELS